MIQRNELRQGVCLFFVLFFQCMDIEGVLNMFFQCLQPEDVVVFEQAVVFGAIQGPARILLPQAMDIWRVS